MTQTRPRDAGPVTGGVPTGSAAAAWWPGAGAFWRLTVLVAWVLGVVLSPGCGREPEEYTAPVDQAEPDATGMRVVSLAPALTQMIVDMGLGYTIVGVAEHDAAAPDGARVVGHFQDVNSEALLAARPTHVLVMTDRSGVPSVLSQLATTQGFRLVTYPSPKHVWQVSRIIYNPEEFLPAKQGVPGNCLGSVLGAPGAAMALTMKMHVQLAQVSEVTAEVAKPSVLMVIETNPLMASGGGTIHDQLLRYAGGQNAAVATGMDAPTFDREKLVALDPQVVLLLLPDAPPLGAIDEDPRLAELRGLPIRAVTEGKVFLINDPLVQLPSSSMARVAAAMAKKIHPELATRIDAAMATSLLTPAEPTTSDDVPE